MRPNQTANLTRKGSVDWVSHAGGFAGGKAVMVSTEILLRKVRKRLFFFRPKNGNVAPMLTRRRRFHAFFLILALGLQPACSPHRLFYYPNRHLYADPAQKGMPYDLLEYPSLNGKKLYAILFKTPQTPKGTIVHFHGNFGNVSNHFMQSQFLVNHGFDVLLFDYEGYGGSEGDPGPKVMVEDGIATVRYAEAHLRPPGKGVVVFGQSIGAAVATVVTAQDPSIKGAVLEAGFNSYRSIARDVLKRSVWTWAVYPFYPLLLGRTYDPERHIAKISPRPVLLIHGDKDHVVPMWMSKRLFERAREPKELHIVKGADHLECLGKEGKAYEDMLDRFFTDALSR
jgi:fermentation-respiration switch protein FrsA (DUF1100 family)